MIYEKNIFIINDDSVYLFNLHTHTLRKNQLKIYLKLFNIYISIFTVTKTYFKRKYISKIHDKSILHKNIYYTFI